MAISGDNHWSSESRQQHWSEYELHGVSYKKYNLLFLCEHLDSAPFFVGLCYSSFKFSLLCFLLLFFFYLSSFCVLWPKLSVSLEWPFLIVPFTIPRRLLTESSTPHQAPLAVNGTKSTGKCIYNWHAIAANLLLVNKWFELLSFQ